MTSIDHGIDHGFTGSIPDTYTRCMGPIFFAPFADILAGRLAGMTGGDVLESACGTGIATRALRAALPGAVAITATDLNVSMLDHARTLPGGDGITWRQADAQALPFPDAAFDAVVCSFGVMFFPDKVAAFREARRVLRRGGQFLFTVWDRLEASELMFLAHTAVGSLFPRDPPGFFRRTPCGYHDIGTIRADLAAAGFVGAGVETLERPCRAATARDAAIGMVRGTPLCGEVALRDPAGLDRAVEAVAVEIASRFGPGPVEARMRAHVVTVRRQGMEATPPPPPA
ncbi:class I SAM-dependent methyltransferase [Humitalea sp. 24SJ18S-53]|uniref:class I SAM-dependent methyltransferase n=1 Tax=Humitalea sp. 24SJ18S-53 TaxID=3422307 RepID=UPI003D67674B